METEYLLIPSPMCFLENYILLCPGENPRLYSLQESESSLRKVHLTDPMILLRQMPKDSKCVMNTETIITSSELRWEKRNVKQVKHATFEKGNTMPEDSTNASTT